MEPLSVFGLVVNIVQLIDFSARLVRGAHELHQSASGQTDELLELDRVANSLSQLCDNVPAIGFGQQQFRMGLMSNEFSDIATKTKQVATELIAAIQRLKLNEGPMRRWRSFRQALATIWHRDEIEKLQRRLKELRSQLHANMTSHVLSVVEGLSKRFDGLRNTFEQMKSPRASSIDEITRELGQTRLSSLNEDYLRGIENALAEFRASQERFEREQAILNSLKFDLMNDRYHAINEAHEKTFEWIYEPECFPYNDPRSRIKFRAWLESGDGIYWVSGKPGSGKSTLMKYLCNFRKTRTSLLTWARGARLGTASFYFWLPGSQLQCSQLGLLRHILYDLLREFPALIPQICTEWWKTEKFDTQASWTVGQLKTCLARMETIPSDTKICLFVDGLDEYDGDHLDLITVISRLSQIPNIKLCVSSRRWPCFEDAFGTDADHKLYLEDLTCDDIALFARNRLEQSHNFYNLHMKLDSYTDLITEITRKAQGVFLWVFLVVRSLRDGLVNGDNADLLRQRLDELPSDLEGFIERLLSSVDQIYRVPMAVTFKVALLAPGPIDLLAYWHLDEQSLATRINVQESLPGPNGVLQREESMIRLLNGRYKGLLEATGHPGARTVNFLHRTVRDYLKTTGSYHIYAVPHVNAFTKISRALMTCTAVYGSRAIYRLTTLEYFVMFSRRAEIENEKFDWSLIGQMDQAVVESFGSPEPYLCELVRFGFISGLHYLISRNPERLDRYGVPLLEAALEVQSHTVRTTVGSQPAVDMLDWLLQQRTYNTAKKNVNSLLAELIVSVDLFDLVDGDYQYSNTVPTVPYDLWGKYLIVFLRHGADINDALMRAKLLDSFPFTPLWRFDEIDETDATWIYHFELLQKCSDTAWDRFGIDKDKLQLGLSRLSDTYAIFLRYGLQPNRPRKNNTTIWQAWLWQICELQTSNGLFGEECIKAMRIFLSNGANPFEEIRFISKRVNALYISVYDILENFFGEEDRKELYPILEAAQRRWHDNEQHDNCDLRSRKRSHLNYEEPGSTSHSYPSNIAKRRRKV